MSRKTIISAVILVLIVSILINHTNAELESERRQSLMQAVHNAAVSCYAVEGFYPADIEYLKENYGLIADEKGYTIIYNAFASNILPEIAVLPNE